MPKNLKKKTRCRSVDGGLSPEMASFSRRIRRNYKLEPQHGHLLTLAAEAWDRSREARRVLREEGLTVETRLGETKAHPMLAVERDARLHFARLIRELGLAEEATEVRVPRGAIG